MNSMEHEWRIKWIGDWSQFDLSQISFRSDSWPEGSIGMYTFCEIKWGKLQTITHAEGCPRDGRAGDNMSHEEKSKKLLK